MNPKIRTRKQENTNRCGFINLFKGKNLQALLFSLAGALFIAALLVGASLWNDGATAGNNAQMLLNASGFGTPSGDAPTGASILDTELAGYSIIARLDIESLDIHLPVLSQTSDKALKYSICYYQGPTTGENGNLVITGHNYRNGAHFGKLDQIKLGAKVTVTDRSGNTFSYTAYKLEYISPDNAEALNSTSYASELTLLTCQSNGNKRLIVRCSRDA